MTSRNYLERLWNLMLTNFASVFIFAKLYAQEYIWSTNLQVRVFVKLWILTVVLATGVIGYLAIEVMEWKKGINMILIDV